MSGISIDYGGVARELMDTLSKKELEPHPHYRILRASYENNESSKVWKSGMERHEIGYSFLDNNISNSIYKTVFTGYIKVDLHSYVFMKMEVSKKEKEKIDINLDFKNPHLINNYKIIQKTNERSKVRISFTIKQSTKTIILEVLKRVRQTPDGNRVLLKIRNQTKLEKIKTSKSFEFGNILEIEIMEISENKFRIPLSTYKGFSLLPIVDTQKFEGISIVHKKSFSKESFQNIYIASKTLKFRDYYISDVEIPRIKSSGIRISSLSKELEKYNSSLNEWIQKYIYEKIESKNSTLYRFQVESIKEILKQLHGDRIPILITAKTAAGKTEAFIIPVINHILKQKEKNGYKHGVYTILMYPTKALANDQLQRIFEIVSFINSHLDEEKQITIGVFHGDIEEKIAYEIPIPLKCTNSKHTGEKPRLKVEENVLFCPVCKTKYPFVFINRDKILSNPPDILIATPDIIHYSLSFDKERHILFYSKDKISPDVVVLDELHLFYSIFGKNVSLMLKRLENLIQLYSNENRKIQFIGASATIKNPKRFGKAFFNSEIIHITTNPSDYDYEKAIKKTMIFAMPSAYRMVDTASYSLISLLGLKYTDLKTLMFVNTLTVCDMIRTILKRRMSSLSNNNLVSKIGAHNSTFTKQERADIEEKFNRGEISVLISTSTLEVGVDFKDIDILMLYGVPYSFNNYLQRIGRAGRRRNAIVYILLNPTNPVDITYYRDALKIVIHPDIFIEYPPFPEHNKVLDKKHIISAISDYCAANNYDRNEIIQKIYNISNQNVINYISNYLKKIGFINSKKELENIIIEIYNEFNIKYNESQPFDLINHYFRLSDIRTSESGIEVNIEPYSNDYQYYYSKRSYHVRVRKKHGFTDDDIKLIDKIKGRSYR